MKQILKLTVFLAIVASLSAGAMSYVYNLTHPIIVKAQEDAEKKQLKVLYDDHETFKKVSDSVNGYEHITSIYEVNKNEEIEGYIYKISTPGYGGNIVYLIAISNDGTYKGYTTIDVSTETSGFGSCVGTDEMEKNIVGKKTGDKIDALSGATISSTAVIKGLDEAKDHFSKYYS